MDNGTDIRTNKQMENCMPKSAHTNEGAMRKRKKNEQTTTIIHVALENEDKVTKI